jgi:hypothetical protein
VSEVPYDYKTVWGGVRKHKTYTRRKNLQRLLKNFDPNKSEAENLVDNGIPMVFDSGKKKWELLSI